MGNTPIPEQLRIQSPDTWQVFRNESRTDKVRNRLTKQTAVYHEFKDVNDQYVRSCQLRQKYGHCLVKVIGIISNQEKGVNIADFGLSICGFSNNSHIFNKHKQVQDNIIIIYEDILYRLPDLGALKFRDALYILKQCLQAFKILVDQYGPNVMYNQLQQEMIGINKSGQCKIWLNNNYYSLIQANQPICADQNLVQQNTNIVSQIFEYVQTRMQSQLSTSQCNQYYQTKDNKMGKHNQDRCQPSKYEYSIERATNFINLMLTNNNINAQQYMLDVPTTSSQNRQDQILQLKQKGQSILCRVSTQLSLTNNWSPNRKGKISLKNYNNIGGKIKNKVSHHSSVSTNYELETNQVSQVYFNSGRGLLDNLGHRRDDIQLRPKAQSLDRIVHHSNSKKYNFNYLNIKPNSIQKNNEYYKIGSDQLISNPAKRLCRQTDLRSKCQKRPQYYTYRMSHIIGQV